VLDLAAMPLHLKQIREERGITQETIAALTGLTAGQISKIENGKSDYSGSFLERAAEALGVTPAELLGGIAPASKEEIELLEIWRTVPWTRSGLFLRMVISIATAMEVAPEEEYKHLDELLRKARAGLVGARRDRVMRSKQERDNELRKKHGVVGFAETDDPYSCRKS